MIVQIEERFMVHKFDQTSQLRKTPRLASTIGMKLKPTMELEAIKETSIMRHKSLTWRVVCGPAPCRALFFFWNETSKGVHVLHP